MTTPEAMMTILMMKPREKETTKAVKTRVQRMTLVSRRTKSGNEVEPSPVDSDEVEEAEETEEEKDEEA